MTGDADVGDFWPDLTKYKEKLKAKLPDFKPGSEKKLQDILADISDKMTWKRWCILAFTMLILILGGSMLVFGTGGSRRELATDQVVYVEIKSGMSAGDISDELVRRGVLTDKFSFWWRVKRSGAASKFKSGMYAMHPNMTADEVLTKLINGDTAEVKFTIPEGFGVKEIAKRLADEGLVDEQEFLAKAKDFAPYPYIDRKSDIRYACEGFLFPDTYILHEDATVDGILKMMAKDFDNRLTPDLRARAKAMNLSLHELITLASLVEKEAMYEEDRAIIAQVFFKRLRVGMPLQSDTTLQYLLDAPKEDVSLEDTRIESPYNTYQHRGLPPGPIASPGMASIKAVLYPADTDYLYFVADRQGHNHYSTNYSDHQAIVEAVR